MEKGISLKDKQVIGYLFVLPALVFMCIFIGYPIIYNIILSFQDVNVMTIADPKKAFIGLGNYFELFEDPVLRITLVNTLFYTIFSLIFQFAFGFMLALFFNKKFILSNKIRGIIMISWLIPVTVTSLLFKFMFSYNGGIINETLHALHIINKPVEWLINPTSAMWSLIITNTWIGIPFNMILLITGLSAISPEIYESSAIDGATAFQNFFHITAPLLRPAIAAVIILGFIYTFKVFDIVYVMTKGGPVNSTEMLSTYAYRLSFVEFSFSKGAAVANILFMILFVFSLFYLKLIKDDEVM
jgi:multiple sugar transport system permease protein